MEDISSFFFYRKTNGESVLPPNCIEDLNLNELFENINHCNSCIGQQYLYYLLLSGKTSGIEKHEDLITSLTVNYELRDFLISKLKKLNHPDAYSIVSIFDNHDIGVSAREKRCINICRFLPVLFLVLLLTTHILTFLVLFLLALITNAIFHYRGKSKIQGYYFSIPQLLKMLKQAERLVVKEEFANVTSHIQTDLKVVEVLKRYISYFRFNVKLENDMAIIAYLVAEIIRIFFLHEAYAVYKTFDLLKEKSASIYNIYCFLGFLDSIYSVSVLRENLLYYCLPGQSRVGERLRAQSIYHPLLENCVSNHIVLHDKSVLITGSNMAGKTSFIRTIGVNLLTAKALHTCFAECFEMDMQTTVVSSIHQADNLMENKSYFMQEVLTMKEFICKGADGNNLFLLDELFKGTNTHERIAITKAVLSWLIGQGNFVFASTHDLELAELLKDKCDLYYFSESVKEGILSFDYRLKAGVSTEHNAIKILQLCDFPTALIQEAYFCISKN